jgi:hypothetical protein
MKQEPIPFHLWLQAIARRMIVRIVGIGARAAKHPEQTSPSMYADRSAFDLAAASR